MVSELLAEYIVIVWHPQWLPESDETTFIDSKNASRLEESAIAAGFNVKVVRNDPIYGRADA